MQNQNLFYFRTVSFILERGVWLKMQNSLASSDEPPSCVSVLETDVHVLKNRGKILGLNLEDCRKVAVR